MNIRGFIAPIMAALAVSYGASLAVADEFDEGQIKLTREALNSPLTKSGAPDSV
jgi:hypothetical protein